MNRSGWVILCLPMMLGLLASTAMCQPQLLLSGPDSYIVGEQLEPEIWVYNSKLERVLLLSLLRPETEVVVLVIFGGAANSIPEEPFRGPLWCQDSFDDLAVQRALVSAFRDRPVQFIPVAVPPIYSAERYGFADVFLQGSDDAPEFQEAFRTFVDQTEAAHSAGLLPFDEVFYDPRGLLIRKAESGGAAPWQGKLKWHLDPRKYGAPTIWILSGTGSVAREPFWGNEYDGDSFQINYEFRDLNSAILELLEPNSAGSE